MDKFLIKKFSQKFAQKELDAIEFDDNYKNLAIDKFQSQAYKIFNLTPIQATILKQTALSCGTDCAVHKDVLTQKIEYCDAILFGTTKQIKQIIKKLLSQPFKLKILAQNLEYIIQNQFSEFQIRQKVFKPNNTYLMGILNITPNSFSDGGEFIEENKAIEHFSIMIEQGADIIDIGAESTRPGAAEIDENTQLDKLLPILNYINKHNIKIPISIDTRNSNVAEICIKNGANIINDVSGFDFDNKMAEIISQNPNTKVIIQHSKGTPETMQDNPNYENTIDEIYFSLNKKIETAINFGIKKENIITDPGIGFGKTREDNFKIIKHWKEFKTLGCPVMIGLSRKSLLGIPESSNEEKDMYSLALSTPLIYENIDYLRVHNVKIYKKFMDILPNSY